MTTVGIRELRNMTSSLLARAQAGEVIVIARHGVPIAKLEPPGRNCSRS
ncbi:type II toxin-antitoxin system prevent-host-death family antitoxin [Arthrobacter sp. I2-34]|uniref:Antitoxin n=1 Tax=Arthrobacter hankyongi TaxID=2904801 RepID=A0ABS9LBU6_9MICC|nr:type II toxin-antitoxin system prevent-host-death family antitoxin [Arthrobacter hankyongi]MCG2624146.1 type II toxin-antitoxin system prevent-host-death family antitoxin [Arthrobacter hankyongi]